MMFILAGGGFSHASFKMRCDDAGPVGLEMRYDSVKVARAYGSFLVATILA